MWCNVKQICVYAWRSFPPWLWPPWWKCQWWVYTTTALTLSIHCFLAYLLSMKGNVDVVICWTTLTNFLVFRSYISLWHCISVWTSVPAHADVVTSGRRTFASCSTLVHLNLNLCFFSHLSGCVAKLIQHPAVCLCPCVSARKQEIIKVTEQLIEAINNGDFEAYTWVSWSDLKYLTCNSTSSHLSLTLIRLSAVLPQEDMWSRPHVFWAWSFGQLGGGHRLPPLLLWEW